MTERTIDRALARAAELGMNQSQLSAKINVLPQYLTNWKRRGLPSSQLEAMASALNWTVDELLGRGPSNSAKEATDDAWPRTPDEADFALIQQLDVSASCGDGCLVDHVEVKGGLAFKRSSLQDFGVTESNARVIYASGGSMWPTIQDGCVVLINITDTTPREGKVYAICTPDGLLLLKRLVRDYVPSMQTQAWIMRSDNPDKKSHPDKLLPPDDRTHIVGRAIWNDNRL